MEIYGNIGALNSRVLWISWDSRYIPKPPGLQSINVQIFCGSDPSLDILTPEKVVGPQNTYLKHQTSGGILDV